MSAQGVIISSANETFAQEQLLSKQRKFLKDVMMIFRRKKNLEI